MASRAGRGRHPGRRRRRASPCMRSVTRTRPWRSRRAPTRRRCRSSSAIPARGSRSTCTRICGPTGWTRSAVGSRRRSPHPPRPCPQNVPQTVPTMGTPLWKRLDSAVFTRSGFAVMCNVPTRILAQQYAIPSGSKRHCAWLRMLCGTPSRTPPNNGETALRAPNTRLYT